MRVFVTGATGFIGSAVVKELIQGGHEVIGLARSVTSAQGLTALGAKAHIGQMEDLESLRKGANGVNAAIHLAFYHKLTHASFFTRLRILFGGSPRGIIGRFLKEALNTDQGVLETLSGCLTGSNRALIVPFATMAMTPGRLAIESDATDPNSVGGRRGATEHLLLPMVSKGIRAVAIRLPPAVHDRAKQGLVTMLMDIAKKKGVSAYVGDGQNRWPAVHVLDTAHLFRLALENAPGGAKYHGIGEEAIPFKKIAEAIGQKLNLPVVSKTSGEAAKHFGFLAGFVANDNPTSGKITQQQLGWMPTGPGLIEDIL